MLSAHACLIAAIFLPYLAFMITLGVYIYRTGQPRRRDEDDGEAEREPLAAAA